MNPLLLLVQAAQAQQAGQDQELPPLDSAATPEAPPMEQSPLFNVPNPQAQPQTNGADIHEDKYVERDAKHTGLGGVARDILGTLGDFLLTRLRMPAMYGPAQANRRLSSALQGYEQDPESAINRVTSINPTYGMQLRDNHITQDANAEYKQTQAGTRIANLVSGLGQGLLNGALGAPPEAAQAMYDRARPALQSQIDKLYGAGVMPLPDEWSEDLGRQLSAFGYTGGNVQRERAVTMHEMNARQIAQLRADTQRAIASAGNDTKLRVAQIMASTSLTRAQMEAEVRRELGLAPTTVTETPTGGLVNPGTVKTTTRGGPAAAAPAPSGSDERRFYNGHWYTRGPNGEAVKVQ